MIKRMMVALGTGLICVGSTFAQAPATIPSVTNAAPAPALAPAPAMTDKPALSAADVAPSASTGSNYWVTTDYLLGWFRGDNLPALATTSPAGTARTQAGVLDSPTTSVLYGNHIVNNDARSGFNLGAGAWLNTDHTFGVEAGFTMFESQSSLFSQSASGSMILARPYNDVTTGLQQSVLISYPGSSNGSLDIRASSSNFYEAHFDFSENVYKTEWYRVDALLGYRFYKYDEGLHIQQNVTPTNANFVSGTHIVSDDDFTTHNTFNGGDFGFRTEFDFGQLSLSLLGKLAVGGVDRDVKIFGSQTTSVPGTTPVTQLGGLYALQSNIGVVRHGEFAVMPELGADLNWQIMSNVKARIGYSIFMLERVARAADQIDGEINPALLPPASTTAVTPNRPLYNSSRTDVWAQSLNLGLEFSF